MSLKFKQHIQQQMKISELENKLSQIDKFCFSLMIEMDGLSKAVVNKGLMTIDELDKFRTEALENFRRANEMEAKFKNGEICICGCGEAKVGECNCKCHIEGHCGNNMCLFCANRMKNEQGNLDAKPSDAAVSNGEIVGGGEGTVGGAGEVCIQPESISPAQ